MQKAAMTEESFVRQLPYNTVARLVEILDFNNLWERLASKIPAKPDSVFNTTDENFLPRYTTAHIAMFSTKRSSTRALIADWGTQNCKIKHLVEALYQAELKAAAIYIQGILHTEPRQSFDGNRESDSDKRNENGHPEGTRGEREPVGEIVYSPHLEPHHSEREGKKSGVLVAGAPPTESPIQETEDQNLKIGQPQRYKFSILQSITNNFDHRNFKDGGNLIGEGGFGTVFKGTFSTGYEVAVKCLKDSTDDSLKQIEIEVKTLAKYKHENLVQLLGYSILEDGPCCLVYQYMPNGSLEERIACRYDTEPLLNNIRLEIMKGTARGIAFLHKGGLVHRDIKSANILLDAEFNPKVGDFATARVFPFGMTSQIMKASVVIGTRAYLAPEAYSFVIHPSLDSYSFGVVILEILTGLPVTDHGREEIDLKILVQEHCCEGEQGEEHGTIHDLLDKRGGFWNKSIVERLYSISCRCLEAAHKKRPKMSDILSELEGLDQFSEDPEEQ